MCVCVCARARACLLRLYSVYSEEQELRRTISELSERLAHITASKSQHQAAQDGSSTRDQGPATGSTRPAADDGEHMPRAAVRGRVWGRCEEVAGVLAAGHAIRGHAPLTRAHAHTAQQHPGAARAPAVRAPQDFQSFVNELEDGLD